eukprot:CAMPEP_0174271246 /NCGR_PEP_ID=MMETSP0439-20130205/47223_1 /TAXON_ID=0 /ORGANISM="Stereomyxa ramosa, Strain Chinc5" /LENGTH=122 /DNA_ID=CAMNT_0015361115 /DNA_START=369 /DNA_END=734 /DNA_ORIENTATION=-
MAVLVRRYALDTELLPPSETFEEQEAELMDHDDENEDTEPVGWGSQIFPDYGDSLYDTKVISHIASLPSLPDRTYDSDSGCYDSGVSDVSVHRSVIGSLAPSTDKSIVQFLMKFEERQNARI